MTEVVIGGSTIPFLISIALITFGGRFGIDTTLAVRISVMLTAVWWAVFTIPFLKNVRQCHSVNKPESGGVLRETFIQVARTAKKSLLTSASSFLSSLTFST